MESPTQVTPPPGREDPAAMQEPITGRVHLAMALVAVLSALMAMVTLAFPFGRDQGIYAYTAWSWLDGAALYRDVFVFKPPGSVFTHALAQLAFGHSMIAIRILDVCWTVGTVLVIMALAWRMTRQLGLAMMAGLLYAFLYSGLDYWSTAQTDGWINLPAAGALLATWVGAEAAESGQQGRGRALFLLAGVLVGIGMLFKYSAVLVLLPAAVILARSWRPLLRGALAIGVGMLLPILGCALWLLASGSMEAFVDTQFGLVPQYVTRAAQAPGVHAVGAFARLMLGTQEMRLVLLLMIAGLVGVASRLRGWGGRREAVVSLVWLIVGVGAGIAQNKFFAYHFLMMLPAVAISAAFAWSRLVAQLGRVRWAVMPVVALCLLVVSAIPQGWLIVGRIVATPATLMDHWQDHPDYLARDASVADNLRVAAFAEGISSPGDTLFLWGFDPMVNFVARRHTVSRFLYNYPFAVVWQTPDYKTELLTALAAAPPDLFVVSSGDATPHVTGNLADSRKLFEQFEALREFVATHYRYVTRIARFDVYQRMM